MEEMQGNVSEQVVSAQPEEVTTNIEDTSVESTEIPEISVNEEVAEPQNVEETVDNVEENSTTQSPEENSRFAKLRREAESRGMDRVIQEMQLEWNGKPITTYADYRRALREQSLMQEAEKQGIDPQFYTDFKNMQEEVQAYRQEKTFIEQDKELSNDSVKGQFYNQWKDEIKDMATTYGVDLRTAFTLTLEEKLPEILNGQAQKIQNETIKKINENSNSSVGSLSEQGENPSSNAWTWGKDDFNKMLERAKNGELRRY